jgi:glycosyltransferase involved in cell wall biosynthesis
VGWGPTVREISHLSAIADQIIHLAPLYTKKAPSASLSYTDKRVQFIPLKPSGGKGLKKLSVLFTAFHNLNLIHQYTKKADHIQFRSPTGMGIYVLPYLRFFRNKKYWVKYAGNWIDENIPLGNKLQKLFLLNFISSHTKVTYNGHWVKKLNFLSFENPCLTEEEYQIGKEKIPQKEDPFIKGWQICFVGNLTEHKGVHLLLQALEKLENNKINIEKVHIIGDGPLMKQLKSQANRLNISVVFHGYLKKGEVNKVLFESHALVLPSKSEGFPKVVSEAMNFGCIPVVTDISCIKQYIRNDYNGILIKQPKYEEVALGIETLLYWDMKRYTNAVLYNSNLAGLYTYSVYNKMLQEKVLYV